MSGELPRRYLRYHQTERPMAAMQANWVHGSSTGWHAHPRGQLLYAIEGVMSVRLATGSWLVPPNRGLWIVAGAEHDVRMSGDVKMRTAYIDASAFADLPQRTCVVNVSPLLRELVVAASQVPLDYAQGSRDERLMHLLVDELRTAEVLPLYLPGTAEPRLRQVCQALLDDPASTATAGEWAGRLGMSTKTLQRLFVRETGMPFAQWREQARLLFALRRIAGGGRIIDIALDCGYASQSAFTAMFRRHFGAPPSAFCR
ncbi:MAG: helix-turn-helix transcriptional regulator [Burkholderiaceae bacterium]|jgi:AraC-like DNA-binding protein/mannose-6-phosphate isomerase-like protein (cupin superfamily)|nr:helix-turn-helix transcriptional regulator [Burkholderiaceae bacterium]